MKRSTFIILLCSAFFVCSIVADAQQGNTRKSQQDAAAESHYVFVPEMVYPLSAQVRQVTPGFQLIFSKDTLISYLPYFGRAYNVDYNTTKGAMDFTSTRFEYDIQKSKKGEQTITLRPKDNNDVREIQVTIYSDSSAFVQAYFNQRQNISYRGRISSAGK